MSSKKKLQQAAASFRRANPAQSAVYRGLISVMARVIRNSGASEVVIHANNRGIIYGAYTKEGQELKLA